MTILAKSSLDVVLNLDVLRELLAMNLKQITIIRLNFKKRKLSK